MLLSHIKELINSKKEFSYSYEVYEELIKFWLLREADKKDVKTLFISEKKYKNLLISLSVKLAINIYEHKKTRGGLFFPNGENINVGNLSLINFQHNTDRIIKSKSLLTRNSVGDYKFSHKSFLEYFLALYLIQNPNKIKNFNFDGFDQLKIFLKEMINVQFIKFGKIDVKSKNNLQIQLMSYKNFNINHLLIFNNIESFEIFDSEYFKNAYLLIKILNDEKSFNNLCVFLKKTSSLVSLKNRYNDKNEIDFSIIKIFKKLKVSDSILTKINNRFNGDFDEYLHYFEQLMRHLLYYEKPEYSRVFPFAVDQPWISKVKNRKPKDIEQLHIMQDYARLHNKIEEVEFSKIKITI